ncbi:LysR family transcriptional regulator [Shewanella sp. 202IG2-18]|uniref:LysR family transcriptional regulator n=1 Tax=Parashewanella hymeniacidonis TaxID=2807618 RepID=UPI001960CBC7|nr:LysR family transcriptional regulator [Parashewanella hymeniacidonis]MBM7074407.1 LysR family transcriptional regulator [Parashewanella hymeniacidonis]
MNNLSALPVFVSVVKLGSFSKAAAELKITTSAISKRISQLENDLDARLFNRTTRSLTLTEMGKVYFDFASKAIEHAQQGAEALQGLKQKPMGKLKINAPMSFGRLHLAKVMPEFLNLHPDIEVELSLDDRMIDYVTEGIDVGIRVGNLPDNSLIAQRLAPCTNFLCATPQYLRVNGLPEKPIELEKHNCLFYSYYRAGFEWTFFKDNEEYSVKPRGTYQVNNSEALKEALLQDIGIGNMPLFIIENELKNGTLVTVLDDYQLPRHAINVVYPNREHLPPKVIVFVDFLKSKFKTDTPNWT